MRGREVVGLLGAGVVGWARRERPAIRAASSRFSEQPLTGRVGGACACLRCRLQAGGHVEGRNVRLAYNWSRGRLDQLSALAVELAREPVSVLVAVGGSSAALAAKEATGSIPIVF